MATRHVDATASRSRLPREVEPACAEPAPATVRDLEDHKDKCVALGHDDEEKHAHISQDDKEFRKALLGLSEISKLPSLATTVAHCTATVVSFLATYMHFRANADLKQLVNKGDAEMVDKQKVRLYQATRYAGAASAVSAVTSLVGGIMESAVANQLDTRVAELIAERGFGAA
jgi:hypothetical protein